MSSFAAEVDTLSGDTIVEESEVSDSLVIDEVFEQEVVDNEEQEEIVQEEAEEEPVQEEVVEKEQEQLTEEQVKDIAQTVVEENSQGHVNEEQVNVIVEENLKEEILSADKAEYIMMLIEYELDTMLICDDGTVLYVPSVLLEQYPCYFVSSSSIYFVNDMYISYDSYYQHNKLYYSGNHSYFVFKDKKLGDFVNVYVSTSDNSVRYSRKLDECLYFSKDLFLDGNLIVSKNINLANEFVVRFITGYDDISFDYITTDENGLVESLPVPDIAPNGFSFGGWYLDELYNTQVDESYKFTSNTTLYAKWVENDATIEMIDYTEKLEKVSYLLEYVIAIMVFFVIVIICKYIYGFFNIFF